MELLDWREDPKVMISWLRILDTVFASLAFPEFGWEALEALYTQDKIFHGCIRWMV